MLKVVVLGLCAIATIVVILVLVAEAAIADAAEEMRD